MAVTNANKTSGKKSVKKATPKSNKSVTKPRSKTTKAKQKTVEFDMIEVPAKLAVQINQNFTFFEDSKKEVQQIEDQIAKLRQIAAQKSQAGRDAYSVALGFIQSVLVTEGHDDFGAWAYNDKEKNLKRPKQ